MSSPAGLPANHEWTQFLELDEQLLAQPTAADQCRLVLDAVRQITSGDVIIWLARPFYPLPGEAEMKTLPSDEAPQIVTRAYESRGPVLDLPGAVAIPLTTQDHVLGVIAISKAKKDALHPAALDHLQGLAAHAALAMQISRQVAIKNWRLHQLSLVRSVSAQIANLPNLDLLSSRVTHLIQETFDYYYVGIFTLEEEKAALRLRAYASQAIPSGPAPVFSVQRDQGIIGHVAQTGEEILAPDVRRSPHFRHLDALPETLSEVALPLKIENRVLGVLDIQSDQREAFHEIDMLVLRTLADHIALAVEGARLYSTVQRRADQMSAVFEISHALASILDPDRLLEEVVQSIQRRFGYPFVHLYTVHPGRRKVFYRAGSGSRSQAYEEAELAYDLDDPRGIIPWVARTGQTLLSNDVSQEPQYRPNHLPPYETNSELTIPLTLGDEVIGVLDIQSDLPNAFDQNDRSLLEALGASIAVAMRNATLYRSEQWRRQVGDSFHDVAGLLSANVAVEKLLDRILDALDMNLPCQASAIWLVEESDGRQPTRLLQLAAVHGVEAEKIIAARQESAVIRDWLDQSLRSDQPNIRKPTDPYGPLGAAMKFSPDYSSIACPMRAGDRVLGVLTLAHSSAGRYGSEARAMTATFASYAAVAIQNARLYADAQQQAWISTVLLQVAEVNQAVTELDELLDNTIDLIPLLIGVKKTAILLWDEAQQTFILSKAYGIDAPAAGADLPEQDYPALARLRATRSTIIVQDPAVEFNLPAASVDPKTGTLLLLPLQAHGEIQGAILVAHDTGSQPGANAAFTEQMLAILKGIAHQTATAIENLRLVEANQEEAYVTAVLLQVAQAVVGQNTLSDVLDTVVHLMPILVGIDACIIYLWDKTRQVFLPAEAFAGLQQQERELLSRSYGPGEFSILDDVRARDTVILCPLRSAAISPAEWANQVCLPPGALPTQAQKTLKSWLIGVPLSIKGEFFGVMVAKEDNERATFYEKRLEIVTGIAQEVALAIQNEHLRQDMVLRERLDREIQLAREIQRTFLPDKLPQPPGWEMDALWQTARQVGGDFYDLFHLPDGRLGIVIADVADKGMPAALYMTVTRTLVRANAQHIHSPARVLERVNNLLIPDAQNGMFVTVVYAILSLSSGELLYANAGHTRPLLLRREQTQVEQLPKGGMALGVMENMPLRDDRIQLDLGDCLLLYTDGVTETFSPDGQPFGEERLNQVLADSQGSHAADLIQAVENALSDFRSGEPMSDDLTLLSICRVKKTG